MTSRRTPLASAPRSPRLRVGLAALVLAAAPPLAACASDDPENDDDIEIEEDQVPVDLDVGDGVDTNVEERDNLGFDDQQPDLDGDPSE